MPQFDGATFFMKEIQLSQGKVALVDDLDFEWLNKFTWHTRKGHNTFYAVRNYWTKDRKCKTVAMHRLIMGVTDPKILVDHEDHDGLNNQRHNIRKCNKQQNISNTTSRKGSTSKYLGVSWKAAIKKWQVQIEKDHKPIYLGVYKYEKDAALIYNEAAKKYFGEFANLNQI